MMLPVIPTPADPACVPPIILLIFLILVLVSPLILPALTREAWETLALTREAWGNSALPWGLLC